jgi:glycosyltransferase EpsF
MNVGGAETLIMNVFRNIDPLTLTFDFLVHTHKTCHFDDEILKRGGRLIRCHPPASTGMTSYSRALKRILQAEHYDAVHSHVQSFSGVVLRAAFGAGVGVRVAHSHNTSDGRSNTTTDCVSSAYGCMDS